MSKSIEVDLVPRKQEARVQCRSKEFGKNVCIKAGCIGCKHMRKSMRLGAIKVEKQHHTDRLR